MSSREIAELTGKLHKNVMADIRKMLTELGYQPAEFSARYIDGKGESRECFNLPRREVEILLTGYSVPLRAKVIDRLHELEQGYEKLFLTAGAAPHKGLVTFTQTEKKGLGRPVTLYYVGKRTSITVPDFAKKLKGVNTQVDTELARCLGLFSTKRLCSAPRRMRPRINGGSPAA